jgi:hypothetical protein
MRWRAWAGAACVAIGVGLPPVEARTGAAQDPPPGGFHDTLDEVLDQYVRDGFVYYRALKSERGRFDRFIAQLGSADVEALTPAGRLAFWLNAYNALVLRTVIDHYPIQGRSSAYPRGSIRQIPGAFERRTHQVARRPVTLDQIEKTILPEFSDPRVYFALGRGAAGGGRLRSEAFTPARLEAQLDGVAAECARRPQCVQVDPVARRFSASPIFSWHEKEFVERYAGQAPAAFGARSPIERAILAFSYPGLLVTEREVVDASLPVVFGRFDWSLNDLTGRGGR